MSQPSPLKVPPELLDRDRLPELLDLLRAAQGGEVHIELSSTPRLATPVLQLVAAAAHDGLRVTISGMPPALAATVGILGLGAVLQAEGGAA